jgi:GntR family transcriptional regulator
LIPETVMPITPLDRSGSKPLWAQLEADLRRRLDEGEFDDRFPTDLELTRGYDVSRHTVREAIRQLNQEGLLHRVRGRGTVVARPEFEQPLGTLYSLFRTIEEQGVEQASQVLSIGEVVDAEAASHLGLPLDAALFTLERIRLAGGLPLAVDQAWLPAELGQPLLGADFSHTALYDELEKRCGCRPDRGRERIMPVVPSARERELLGLEEGEAAFSLERLGQDGDAVIEWRVTLIRGDRYQFVADWSRADTGSMRLEPAERPG